MRKINKRNVIIFSVVLLLLVITAGVSFAFFSYIKESQTENSVTIGNLTFKYTEVSGVGNGITISDALPMSDEDGKNLNSTGSYFDFKVESTLSRSDLEYEIVAESTIDSTLPLEAIKFYLTDITNENEVEIESSLNSNGSVKRLSEFNDTLIEKADGKTIYKETILRNTKGYIKEFRARMWIAEDIDWSNENYIGKSGAIRINVYANSNRDMASSTVTTPQDTSIERVTANNKYLFTKVENNEYQYTLNVPNEIETLDIDVIPSNTQATAEVIQLSRMIGLQYGENYFRTLVTSSDGSKTQEYMLRVYRELDKDNSLFSLEVGGYSLNPIFDPNITEYNLTLEASSIEINAAATSSLASISGIGTKNLNWGDNEFDIIVTSQSGELKTYKIIITNERPTAPEITGGSNSWVLSAPTITVTKAGTTISGVKHYEYYKSTSSTAPTDTTLATGTTTGNITVSDEGTTYIWYRTVSNNGYKSSWSASQTVKLDTAKTNVAITTTVNDTNSSQSLVLNATEIDTLSGSKYQWYKNNSLISGATKSQYTINGTGTYKVVSTLGNGYTSTSEVVIDTYTTNVVNGKTYITAMGTMENRSKCLLKGKYSALTKEIPYDVNTCNLTIANNLVLNGNFEYKDTSHHFDAIGNKMAYSSLSNYLYLPAIYNTYHFGEKIKINSNLKYEISITAEGNPTTTLNQDHLIGIIEYDCRGNAIDSTDIMYVAGSTTTLAKDLKPGDTVVYLTSTSGFNVTSSTPNYQRGFIFWNYKDCGGNYYGVETYSKNFYHNLYTYDNVDKTNNTIKLNSAWTHDIIPAGTSLSQSSAGGTYNYILGFVLPNPYNKISSTITGRSKNGYPNSAFRYGAEYIQPFIDTNYYTVRYDSPKIESYLYEIAVRVVE